MRVRSVVIPSILVAVLLLAAPVAQAKDTYAVDPAHSSIGFKIRHLVSNVTGRFTDFEGKVDLDASDPTRSSVTFTIKAASIDTGNPKRDGHLKSPDFFDVEKYPSITFTSTSIEKGSGSTYKVNGKFTMHGVTREITLPVEFMGTAKDPWGNTRAGFSASFNLDRKDYGIIWNKALDAGGTLLGDDVTASINVEAVKEQPQAPPPGK